MGREPKEGDGPGGSGLALLRGLVIALTATMILGLLVLIGLFVTRFPVPAAPDLPAEIALPAGETAIAITFGPTWYAVVTESQAILIYDRASGALRQRVRIAAPPG
ncbi:MAG: hypothetical protein JKP98_25055 [Rhodobacteraceae bacterium]|jgi:hypothetical protein|nr:hypothetical protein [Paracoccaceae bacterium]MBL4559139.1 hypothetical protein [Paracoccaceae bacterium]